MAEPEACCPKTEEAPVPLKKLSQRASKTPRAVPNASGFVCFLSSCNQFKGSVRRIRLDINGVERSRSSSDGLSCSAMQSLMKVKLTGFRAMGRVPP